VHALKRNHVVLVVLLAAVALMFWAGWANYEHRKQEAERRHAMEATLVPDAPMKNGNPDEPDPTAKLIGKPAPAFTLEDPSGKKISLSDYKGKAVVLDFWATWCAPCKVEIPWLIKLRDQYAAQGLEVIGASTDDLDESDQKQLAQDKKDIADFATKMHINYPVVVNGQSVATPYGGLDALPTTFYIDRKGTIVASGIGLVDRDEIEANIKKALGGQ
jgi:peroxiredoxin